MKTQDYMKAIKKADREMDLESNPGFRSLTKIHRSKKQYTRKGRKTVEW